VEDKRGGGRVGGKRRELTLGHSGSGQWQRVVH